MRWRIVFDTAIGTLYVEEDGAGICGAGFWQEEYPEKSSNCPGKTVQGLEEVIWMETELLLQAKQQLTEYAKGERKEFDLPLSVNGTRFQNRVWAALQTIPYGETRTYGQIAVLVGSPKGSRAVGMTNHNNPVAIIVPCHRVIGAGGKLTGYAGGLDKKEVLLKLEQGK